ncbi:MAG: DUF86 domain-containing protein [Firmicutes bacterium]|nr:DUF86 domain-containing protein [Bacillota bacterium]
MMSDVLLNKVATIERCLRRVKEEYAGDEMSLQNFTKQDSIVLNLQRAIEATIDMAMHIVAGEKLGLPQNSRDAFQLLYERNVIDEVMLGRLSAMIGFRNIAVHDYQQINLQILQQIVEHHLEDFTDFIQVIKSKF